jgi:hypothetical protein
MQYEIHLYVPKTGKLTPAMLAWLYKHGQSTDQHEAFWPVRKINQHALALQLLRLDNTLIVEPGEGGDVIVRYPHPALDITMYCHNRGLVLTFPYVGGVLARVVLGIVYVYITYLYQMNGFWSYDPQLRILSYADDYQSIEETARLMDEILPRLLT